MTNYTTGPWCFGLKSHFRFYDFFTFFIDASAATITILNENYDGQSLDESVQANLTRVRNWEKAFVEFMQV